MFHPRGTVSRLVAASGLAAAVLAAAGTLPAAAVFPSLNGDRIYWVSGDPCDDSGSSAVSTTARISYVVPPGGGYYRLRIGTYTEPDNGRLGLGTLVQSSLVAGGAHLYASQYDSFGWGGEANVTGFVYRWNGTTWALVARESVRC
jgi:hypothetical protein